MFSKRIKIFIFLCGIFLFCCIGRMLYMQTVSRAFYQDRIAMLKKNSSRQIQTVRGKILDRKGRPVALDEPEFQLQISYQLTRLMDERFRKLHDLSQFTREINNFRHVVEKSAQFKGVDPSQITRQIQQINDFVWNRRTFQAWRKNFPQSEVFADYESVLKVPLSAAVADLKRKVPDADKRLKMIGETEIAEMYEPQPLIKLEDDDDIFTAQLEFADIEGIDILPRAKRRYPYHNAAAQTIGWVGPPLERDKNLFEGDELASYHGGEVCGRYGGVEYVCESILRGRRGRVVYNYDKEFVGKTERKLGRDVQLTLDIELQKAVEDFLRNYDHAPTCGSKISVVVMDVKRGEILALVSIPVFDLNTIRTDYDEVAADANQPLLNRAINKQYPPGSAVKPLILVAGMETGNITAGEVISCPARAAPKGWPNCWIFNRYGWLGHDDQWPNCARNAIKGSCNVYFSRLADRIEPRRLQSWLYNFGYGHVTEFIPPQWREQVRGRSFRQAAGLISSSIPSSAIEDFNDVPALQSRDRRWFGIGQGNLRVTPLQVASAMATIARGGVYVKPSLLMEDANDLRRRVYHLNISDKTISTVREGMKAVVNERRGTAHSAFEDCEFDEQGVTVFGKTGSTQAPEHAWFAGFAEDEQGQAISLAVVVEGGQHGSSDAAPLGREIIGLCIDKGYLGERVRSQPKQAERAGQTGDSG